jgi:hypothetical protein
MESTRSLTDDVERSDDDGAQVPERPATCELPPALVWPSHTADDKYLHIKEDAIMDTTDESSSNETLEENRETLRTSLHEIAAEVGNAMRDARLNFPLGLTVPASGNALITLLTSDDPSSADRLSETGIVHEIVAKRLGGIKLSSREPPCAMANATMTAVDLTADV